MEAKKRCPKISWIISVILAFSVVRRAKCEFSLYFFLGSNIQDHYSDCQLTQRNCNISFIFASFLFWLASKKCRSYTNSNPNQVSKWRKKCGALKMWLQTVNSNIVNKPNVYVFFFGSRFTVHQVSCELEACVQF